MTEPLTLDRFRELAATYGGVVYRWPERYRDAAMATASDADAAAILREASALDAALDAWRVAAPADALRDRVMGTAPAQRSAPALRARLWWSGIGIAAALAGAATGTAAVAMVAPANLLPESSTSFGDLGGAET